MSVTIELPGELEEHLRREMPDLDQRAKEALLITLYSEGKLSIGRLGSILGVGAIGADEWLAEHGVPLNYTVEDLRDDIRTLDKFRQAERP